MQGFCRILRISKSHLTEFFKQTDIYLIKCGNRPLVCEFFEMIENRTHHNLRNTSCVIPLVVSIQLCVNSYIYEKIKSSV